MAAARVMIVVASAFVLIASGSDAQTPRRSQEKERRIEQQLATVAPAAVATFHQATIALDKPDYPTAAHLYREVLRLAPAFSPALRRLGSALAAAGQVDEAEDDTHPGPLDRFRLVQRLASTAESTESGTGMVWDLFCHRDALTAEMTAAVESYVRPGEIAATV